MLSLISSHTWSQQPTGTVMNKALILIEFQNQWLDTTSPLNALMQDRQQFEQSVRNARLVLAAARQRQWHIIHVTMTLEPHYRLLGQADYGLRQAIPQARTWLGQAAAIHADFRATATEHVIYERAGASAFAGTTLDSYLRNNRIEQIYLMGYALHVCVESSLRQAHDLGYRSTVIYDASSAFSQAQQQYFLTEVVHHFGHALSSQDFIQALHEH
jgi:nicotinamidase-related amidase